MAAYSILGRYVSTLLERVEDIIVHGDIEVLALDDLLVTGEALLLDPLSERLADNSVDEVTEIRSRQLLDLTGLFRQSFANSWPILGVVQHRDRVKAREVWDRDGLHGGCLDGLALAAGQIPEVPDYIKEIILMKLNVAYLSRSGKEVGISLPRKQGSGNILPSTETSTRTLAP